MWVGVILLRGVDEVSWVGGGCLALSKVSIKRPRRMELQVVSSYSFGLSALVFFFRSADKTTS